MIALDNLLPCGCVARNAATDEHSSHIGRLIGKRFAGLEGRLLMSCSCSTYDVMPAVVPGDARPAINHGPGAVIRADCFRGFTIGLQRNKEVPSSTTHAHFPLTKEM